MELHEPNLAPERCALRRWHLGRLVRKLAQREFTPRSQFFRFRAGKRTIVTSYRVFEFSPFLLAPDSL